MPSRQFSQLSVLQVKKVFLAKTIASISSQAMLICWPRAHGVTVVATVLVAYQKAGPQAKFTYASDSHALGRDGMGCISRSFVVRVGLRGAGQHNGIRPRRAASTGSYGHLIRADVTSRIAYYRC